MLLNKNYNKKDIQSILSILTKSLKTEPLTFDPGLNKKIKIEKNKIILNCWRHYFKELFPLTKNTYKRIEGVTLINTIFANELMNITHKLYINATFFRVGMDSLKNNAEIYKEPLQKNEIKYNNDNNE